MSDFDEDLAQTYGDCPPDPGMDQRLADAASDYESLGAESAAGFGL